MPQTSHSLAHDAEFRFCPACGKKMHKQAKACPTCGLPNGDSTNIPNKTTAALLAIFLGGLGVHKFYIGNTQHGVIYLLFCWTFIPVFLGFIEGLIYLTYSQERWEEEVRKLGDRKKNMKSFRLSR